MILDGHYHSFLGNEELRLKREEGRNVLYFSGERLLYSGYSNKMQIEISTYQQNGEDFIFKNDKDIEDIACKKSESQHKPTLAFISVLLVHKMGPWHGQTQTEQISVLEQTFMMLLHKSYESCIGNSCQEIYDDKIFSRFFYGYIFPGPQS